VVAQLDSCKAGGYLSARARKAVPNSIVCVSDLHCGCRLGLLGRGGIDLDTGIEGASQHVPPSRLQLKLMDMWDEFWGDWVPRVTHGEPYIVVINGDAVDGVHHNSVTQISHSLTDQKRIALDLLGPIVKLCEGRFYMIRGTEAHVGPSGQMEEDLARELGAVADDSGHRSRWELFKRLGPDLIHFTHHIGTTGSSAYESTAVHKETVETYVESGRWGDRVPDIRVRSHRHRCLEVRAPARDGWTSTIVTPAWQLKTPYTFRVAGARLSQPQIGGIVVRLGDEELHTRAKVWRIERPKEE
jgi:hypothetical protein